MSPTAENKKRKHEGPSPQQTNQSDTGSVLSNLPALPPPPTSSPPSLSQTALAPASQRTMSTQTSGTGAVSTATSSKRPKRARSKSEKKEDNERPSRFHCDYCGRDLSSSVRARCAVCPDYDSCLDCFSVGAALLPHKAEHHYRLIEVVYTPIFQAEWSADEEEKLLEGLETFGVGNWEQVAKLIGSKNPFETEQHYLKVYLQSTTAPLPDPKRFLLTEKNPVSETYGDIDPKELRVMHMHQQEDAAGWMPKREDFVYEWDNEAEDIIADMEITDEDTKKDRELKLWVLEIYCRKLNERERRKMFVHERGLTDVKAHQIAEKKRSKEERDLREKLKVFMRFTLQEDMDKFIKGLVEERELRNRIELLREGRNQGAKSFEECQRISAKQAKKEVRVASNGIAGASITTCTGNGAGGEPSVLSGMSQRRARRLNGEGSMSEGTGYNGTNGYNSLTSGTDSKERYSLLDMKFELMPGSELLSSKEIALCKSLSITPHQYLIVKEVMIRESARNGYLRKKDARTIISLDANKVNKIHEFLIACGWVRGGTTGGNGAVAIGGSGNNMGSSNGVTSAARVVSGGNNTTGGNNGGGSGNAGGAGRSVTNALATNVSKPQTERA